MKVLAAFLVNTIFNFMIGLLVAKFLGPEQFGRFALALSVAAFIQNVVVDWIRLAAVRFYSQRSRETKPELRATLDVAAAIMSAALAAGAILFILSGIELALTPSLLGLAVAAAIANGLFDYHTALIRARFLDGVYARLVIFKNILAIILTVGGALLTGSALIALTGACLSMAGSLIFVRSAVSDREAHPKLARFDLAMDAAKYSLPIITANIFYLAIVLGNRALVTKHFGFAETGQFSLAYDMGTRLIAAFGSALDVLLFQIAVRTDDQHGPERALDQISRNMSIVIAILLPAAVGLWFIVPSLEHVLVPELYRGPFGHYLKLLLPGLLCFGLMNFAINPVFQIIKMTRPLITASVMACVTDIFFIVVLPQMPDASNYALAQAGALIVAMISLLIFAAVQSPRWPRARDLFFSILGVIFMALALWPLQGLPAGLQTLGLQVLLGSLVYSLFVLCFDIAGLRSLVFKRLKPQEA
jgi:O-antigen/teichoic acid export membrane protein